MSGGERKEQWREGVRMKEVNGKGTEKGRRRGGREGGRRMSVIGRGREEGGESRNKEKSD